jgi:hypothetical protein
VWAKVKIGNLVVEWEAPRGMGGAARSSVCGASPGSPFSGNVFYLVPGVKDTPRNTSPKPAL